MQKRIVKFHGGAIDLVVKSIASYKQQKQHTVTNTHKHIHAKLLRRRDVTSQHPARARREHRREYERERERKRARALTTGGLLGFVRERAREISLKR